MRILQMSVAISFAALISIIPALAVDSPAPLTSEERRQLLFVLQYLESDPLSENATYEREWATVWVRDVPGVVFCSAFFRPLFQVRINRDYAAELAVQSAYSMAAFLLEHPESADDANAKYLAGVNGTLRAYESIRKQKPEVRWAVLDDLLEKRKTGELAEFGRVTAAQCTSK